MATTEERLRDKLEAALLARWAGHAYASYHQHARDQLGGGQRHRLAQRWRPGMGLFDAYFEGDHELAFATAAYWEAFGPYLGATADNFMPLVVEASVQGLRVQGFRFGKATSADEPTWDIWQANDMDAGSDEVHTEAIKLGEAYWMVDPPKADGDPPLITREHPSQMIVQCSPANPRVRLAALKKWADPDGTVYVNLYTPTEVFKWRKQAVAQNVALPAGVASPVEWQLDAAASGEHGLGEVPVVPVRNTPNMLGQGVSDLAVVVPDQTNINKMLADMMLGSEYQAFPQRVLLGVEAMVDERTGKTMTAAEAQIALSQSRILRLPGKDAKVDQWDAADLKNYVEARNHLLDGLFSKAMLPVNYNARGQIANLSADALRAADKNRIQKVQRKMPAFDGAHEDTMRLAHKAIGDDEKARVMNAEVIWRNPEARTEAELTDAALKKQALGIPLDVILEDLGYSPQKIDRVLTLKLAADAFGPQPLPGNISERISVPDPTGAPLPAAGPTAAGASSAPPLTPPVTK